MSLEDAPFTAKGISPFLERGNRERKEACARATSLLVNAGNAKTAFAATGYLLEPLLALLPEEPAAAGPLAAFAERLTRSSAYPEAAVCIDAVIDRASDVPLGEIEEPWDEAIGGPMTWPRQQALLWLWRGEGRLASGDRAGGDAALAEGVRRAEAAAMPTPFGLLGSGSPFRGDAADRAMWARVQAASALRLRFEGKDACDFRKVKKRKANEKPDRALLELARAYLDDALAVIGPRVAAQYAGLTPKADGAADGWAFALVTHQWQRFAYFESGLVDEHLGDLARARVHLGRAKWISALGNPTHRHEYALQETVARLQLENVPLA